MRLFISILVLLTLTSSLFGQAKTTLTGANNIKVKQIVSNFSINNHFRYSFPFTKEWDYPDYIVKDDSGHFHMSQEGEIGAEDTAHLYFTAKCTTNVQGGYDIRYCFARKINTEILLTFRDGLPAYGSEFYVHIDSSTFCCDVETIYPMYIPGQIKSCTITKQKLFIDKSKYLKGDIIKGFIEMQFIETIVFPKKGTQKRKLFLKGYFKARITD